VGNYIVSAVVYQQGSKKDELAEIALFQTSSSVVCIHQYLAAVVVTTNI
jgi:hypothetical protein